METESTGRVPGERLGDLLTAAAGAFPSKTAAVHANETIDYLSLWQASSKLAHYLREQNLNSGSRVAILVENSIDYIVSFFGVLLSDLVVVPLDTSLNPADVHSLLSDSRAELLIIQKKHRRRLEKDPGYSLSIPCIITDALSGQAVSRVEDQSLSQILSTVPNPDKPPTTLGRTKSTIPPDKLVAIFYTSGSTGSSKGVMLSHRNLISNTQATVEYLGLSGDDSVMVILPFYYIYGNSLLLTHVAVGGTLVIDNRFMYPEVVLDSMEQSRVTGFSGVPSTFMILLDKSTFSKRKLEHLRYFTQAGGALPPHAISRLIAAFPDKQVFIMYGQTEASPRISCVPPEMLREKIGSVGIPVPGVEMRIVDEQGCRLPGDATGEIIVKGDNVMLGYWNRPDETREVIRNGWLHTGDLARMDEDGYTYIVGRKSDFIKSGGRRVSAVEIEQRLLENEEIAEATVYGVADDILGEAIRAAVVLMPGSRADEKDIQAFCRKTLPAYKIPKTIVFCDSLPKYITGKINKQALIGQES